MRDEWRGRAACRGLDGTEGRIDFLALDPPTQKRVCGTCPVKWDCLQDALDREADMDLRLVTDHSVTYGGLTGEQRAGLLRKRRAVAS